MEPGSEPTLGAGRYTAQELLRNWLTHHICSSGAEVGFRSRMLHLLDSSERPLSRDQFDPGHFTASAFVLSPGEDALLLLRHRKLGRWLQPGGHIEPGDRSVADAARREVHEETGLPLAALDAVTVGIFDLDIHPIPVHGDEPAHHHFDVRFLFRSRVDTFDPIKAEAEATEIRWIPLGGVADLSDGSVFRVIPRIQSVRVS